MFLKKRIAVAVTLSLAVSAVGAAGYEPTKVEPLPDSAFTRVEAPVRKVSPVNITPNLHRYPFEIVPVPSPTPKPTAKPTPKPTPKPKIVVKAKPKKELSSVRTTGRMARGVASWYCVSGVSRCTRGHPDGSRSYYAAIRRNMLFLRGRTIAVCVAKDCIPVRIIDCNCGSHANLIDLYGDAFKHFYPLSKGKFNVTIKW